MVDEDRVLRLLRSIADDTAVLRQEAGAVGFRNVLVHDYIEVDDSIVVDRLKSLDDLEEFVRQVAAYVTGAQPDPES